MCRPSMKIRMLQTAPRLGDLDFNFEQCRGFILDAIAQGAELVIFPELSLTGYLLKDMVTQVAMSSDDPRLREIGELSRRISILIGLVEHSRRHLFYNSAFYYENGALVHRHRKAYLPTYGMFDEGRYFSPGNRVRTVETRFGRIGIMICEDAWHPINPYILCQDGAQMLLVISNSPLRGMNASGQFQSVKNWARITQSYALLYSSFLIYVNRVGCEDGISFSGCSQAIDPGGEPILTLPFLEESQSTVDLDMSELSRARIHSPTLRDENFLLSLNELERIKHDLFGH